MNSTGRPKVTDAKTNKRKWERRREFGSFEKVDFNKIRIKFGVVKLDLIETFWPYTLNNGQ